MVMAPGLRKVLLAVHLVSSIGWAGALAGFLVLSVAGITSQDAQTVRSAYVASAMITWFVIVPLAFVSLATGIVQALGTPWGLFRHYWVLFKLLIVVTATFMLMGKTGAIDRVADVAAQTTLSAGDFGAVRFSIMGHAVGGLAVLLWAAALGIWKPRALTPYGRRRPRAEG